MAKFLRRGRTKVFYVPTIAAASASAGPTAAEMSAGIDITGDVAALNGFSFTSTTIDIPNFGTRQTPKIPGEDQAADSSITVYEDDTTNPLRTTLAKDVVGYIVISPNGATTTGSKVDVFPVQVSSNTRQYTSGNEAAQFEIAFAVTGTVRQDVSIAA